MMNDRSKELQFLLGLLAILMLVTSLVPFAQRIPPTSSNIAKGQTEGSRPRDSFIPSYITHSPIMIISNADFVSQGVPGSGTAEDPYVIEGYNITTTGTSITIQDTDAYFVIRDCLLTGGTAGTSVALSNVNHGEIRNNTIWGNYSGLSIYSSSNNNTVVNNAISGNHIGVEFYAFANANTVLNNTISGNDFCGVYISSSSNNTIVNNTISGNDYHGVFLSGSSDNNTVVNNAISGNDHSGMYIYTSSNNTIVDNTISGNRNPGVHIRISLDNTVVNNTISGNYNDGVYLFCSSNNTVVNNTISRNDYHGVFLFISSNNTIVNNTVSGNSDNGVYLSGSSVNNTVVNNTVSGNFVGVSIYADSNINLIYLNVIANNYNGNAYDYGTGNHWNSTGMGNYWSDYGGTGTYHVPGSAGSIDYYPFIYSLDTLPPTIDQPADMNYEVGTTGNTITWTPSDVHPSHYMIYRNGTQVVSSSWDGNSITVEVDGLSVGVYNYTIGIYDTSGNYSNDTILVIVLPQTITDGDVTGLVILFLSVGGIGVIVVVLILIRHRRGSMIGS